jgi:electron transfer flavoprotein-quinone oxidoreductase
VVNEHFDAIVVGAGPAGTSAALTMARAGLKVILLERGQYPGSKNVMGGILYRNMLDHVEDGLSEIAPLERHIIEQRYVMLGHDSATSLGHRNEKYNTKPYNCYSVLRAKFDRFYAQKAVEAGVLLINETTATELIVKDGKVIGVRTDRDKGELHANVVIISDGANSLLAKHAGLHPEWTAEQMTVAVKEVISLPAEKIQDRFNVEGSEGVTLELMGDSSAGMIGMGFIYTNKDSLSIGVGAMVSEMVRTKTKPYELLDRMKAHPMIKRLISGAKLEEYMAHMIPEGGYNAVPKVYGNGYMLCGNAAQLVNAVHREGSNYAMTSGRLAAETAISAKNSGDFSERKLSEYHKALKDSFILKDLAKYKGFPHFAETHTEIFGKYPELVNNAMYEMFLVDGKPKNVKQKEILKKFRSEIGLGRMISTAISGWRATK